MSEESGFGLNLAEKFFGLIILLTGIFALYFTVTSAQALVVYTGLFGFLSIILIVTGLILVIAKTE
jgi:heme/copper-type cytochrome/quinol oxidase subunit 4